MKEQTTKPAAWWMRLAVLLLPLVLVPVVVRELAARKIPLHLALAPHFREVLRFFHFQEGLCIALVLALAGALAVRLTNRWLRFAIYLPACLWAVWIMVWALVRAHYSIQLAPRYALDVLLHPSSVGGMGLNPASFYPAVIALFGLAFALACAGAFLSGWVTRRFAAGTALLYLVFFLLVHLPVRAYITYYANRGQKSVLAMDDWTPLPLGTEYLIPGLRAARAALPNLEDRARTKAYVRFAKNPGIPDIPRKLDLVWIAIESFRADAISEKATPYLWQHAKEFQLRLDRNHWSGGNATQFGLFSLFVGLSGYHLQSLLHEQIYAPMFSLLAQNGYAVRIANLHYFDGFGSFKRFIPPAVDKVTIPGAGDETDRAMVDALLADFRTRASRPACDVVTFGATHWPYYYPNEDEIFTPAAGNLRNLGMARTHGQAELAHNRFRNASHFVDGEIGRIMEARRARGTLERTVVIVTGDHGEEFRERGQVYHGGMVDDFQGRPVLWMHFPPEISVTIDPDALTSHLDIVPTLLDALGFEGDVLRTQGQSLLHPRQRREALFVSEQGFVSPTYNALVTRDYVSRWHNGGRSFAFAGVERRDGKPVAGKEWLEEAKRVYPAAAAEYEILPDPQVPPAKFNGDNRDQK